MIPWWAYVVIGAGIGWCIGVTVGQWKSNHTRAEHWAEVGAEWAKIADEWDNIHRLGEQTTRGWEEMLDEQARRAEFEV